MMNSAADLIVASMTKEEKEKLEKFVQWEKSQVKQFIKDRLCPYPINKDDGTAAMCIANGHCGCDEQYIKGKS